MKLHHSITIVPECRLGVDRKNNDSAGVLSVTRRTYLGAGSISKTEITRSAASACLTKRAAALHLKKDSPAAKSASVEVARKPAEAAPAFVAAAAEENPGS